MPSLDDVTQRFTADVGPYIASLEAAIAKTKELADAVKDAGAASDVFGADAKIAAAMLEAMENAETLLMGVSTLLNSVLGELSDTTAAVRDAAMSAAMTEVLLAESLGQARDQTMSLAMIERLLAEQLGVATRAMAIQAAVAKMLKSALDDASSATARTAATTAAGGGIIAQWWRQWGSVVHWVVMGTLEIAATAIPALVALTAAGAAMAPTFTHIADVMNELRAGTGSWSGAMAASVGPLQAAGAAAVRLREAVAPDAYVIFGAAINSITGHVGAFSGIAQQASNVLAQFATKISTELSGPLGGQLTKFFANSVGYMIQWGQVLGNLGHVFVNVMNAFWGTSHVLLGVLDNISKALLAITSNPVAAWFIGAAAAASALYRWGRLLMNMFTWLGGGAAIGGIKSLGGELGTLGYVSKAAGGGAAGLGEAFATLGASMGPLAWAGLALLPIFAGIMISGPNAADATDKLIAAQNKLAPTMANLNGGMAKMGGNLVNLAQSYGRLDTAALQTAQVQTRLTGNYVAGSAASNKYNSDVTKTINEMRSLANQAVNLVTGLAEAGQRTGALGADMNTMAISTAIADSKIQQVNQAIDQYVNTLVGATAGNANFITSMTNIGTVSATTRNNLGTNTVQLSLNAQQFGNALNQMGAVGAAAWQNLDQVMSGSMQPMMDQLRTMGVTGAVTGQQISQAALDMAYQLSNFAGTSNVARNQILGFLQAQGLSFPNWQKFIAYAQKAGAGQQNLNGIVAAGTSAFSKLSAMAKNAANAMNPLVAQAIDTAALKTSGFDGALAKLQTDMMNHAGPDQIRKDIAAMNGDYQTSLSIAEKTGQGITTASASAASGVQTASQKMGQAMTDAKLKQVNLEQQVQSSGVKITSHTGTVASTTKQNMAQMASAFDMAKAHAVNLQSYIDSMHGKNIVVNTQFTQSSGPAVGSSAPGFGVKPYHGGVLGYQGGGIVGGPGGVDRVPAWLTMGEGILTSAATAALGGPRAIRLLNDNPARAVYGGGGGGGGTALGLNLMIQNKMDNQVVNTSQRKETLIYTRRNPQNNLSLRAR